ncbi:precorrin-3B synthase [Streptomyces sp. NPDC053499]|uniref:precorrin-3B synthase n=1 Tax=Streptomyces sp. NPDC053499 TaxID=3365707 RepID=UPI0037D7E6E3
MVMPSARSSAHSAAPVASATSCAVSRARDDACPGALRLHQADDGGLARVRVPGGVLDTAQAAALRLAAARLGDGDLHLTSRGNIQLRGLRDDSGAELARILDDAGLLPSAAHERVRNIVASPLSGLDGRGRRAIGAWLTELDRLVCASEELRDLSGRFLFAVDDGRGDVASLGADVTLLAEREGRALLRVGADGTAPALRVESGRAAAAAVTAAEVFLETARECDVRAWRVAELPVPSGDLARRIAERLRGDGSDVCGVGDVPIVPFPSLPPTADNGPEPGLVRDPRPSGPVALSVLAPLGRLTGGQWQLLTRTAEQEGGSELRLTPWRGVVVPGIAPGSAPGALAALGDAGLVTDPSSPWRGVGACAGRPGCAKSLTDVRADAAAALTSGGGLRVPETNAGRALPVYWSGCERRCGHPRGERVEVVAGADGYRISVVRATGETLPVLSAVHSAVHSAQHSGDLAATVAAARDPRSPDPTRPLPTTP